MQWRCLAGHVWEGSCICSRPKCGRVAPTDHPAHQWDICICRRCASTRDRHAWDGCRCQHCGTVRDEQHDWDYCRCKRCGMSGGQHDWEWRARECPECHGTGEEYPWNPHGYECRECNRMGMEIGWVKMEVCRKCGETGYYERVRTEEFNTLPND